MIEATTGINVLSDIHRIPASTNAIVRFLDVLGNKPAREGTPWVAEAMGCLHRGAGTCCLAFIKARASAVAVCRIRPSSPDASEGGAPQLGDQHQIFGRGAFSGGNCGIVGRLHPGYRLDMFPSGNGRTSSEKGSPVLAMHCGAVGEKSALSPAEELGNVVF